MNKRSKLTVFLCFVLCVIMAAGSMPVLSAKADEPTDVWYGDVNDDGSIDAKDVTMLRRQLAGGWNVNINEEKADLNQDGEINAKDVTMLRRFLAGGWGVVLPEKQEEQYTIEEYIGEDFYFHIRKIDGEGKVIKETILEFEECRETIEYTYENNKRISGLGHDEDGSAIKVSYEYTDDTVIEDKLYYNSKGEVRWEQIRELEYDNNGKVVERQDVNNNISYNYEYVLDNNGRISQKTETLNRMDGSSTIETYNYSYDENGNVIKIEGKYNTFSGNEKVETISWDYSDSDRVIAEQRYSDGWLYIIEYDKKQNIVEFKWNDDESDLTEKYYIDDNGNIVKYQCYFDEKLGFEDLLDDKENLKQRIWYDDDENPKWKNEYFEDGSIIRYQYNKAEEKWIETEEETVNPETNPIVGHTETIENEGLTIINEYDANGHKEKSTWTYANGDINTYYYNDKDQVVKEEIYDFRYDNRIVFESEYDDVGKKIKYTQVNSDGSRYEHIYDDSEKEIKFIQKFLNEDGTYRVGLENIYEYNDKNQKTKIIESQFYGSIVETYITEYAYNDYGSEIKKSVTTPEGYTAVLETVYDESNRVIKVVETDSDGTISEYPWEYNENGGRKKYTYQPGSSTQSGVFMFQIMVRTLDGNGNVDNETSYIGGKFDYKTEYTYDQAGKCIRHIITHSNGKVVTRELNTDGTWSVSEQ